MDPTADQGNMSRYWMSEHPVWPDTACSAINTVSAAVTMSCNCPERIRIAYLQAPVDAKAQAGCWVKRVVVLKSWRGWHWERRWRLRASALPSADPASEVTA